MGQAQTTYHYADRAKIEAEINEHTRAIMCTNPGNPTGSGISLSLATTVSRRSLYSSRTAAKYSGPTS